MNLESFIMLTKHTFFIKKKIEMCKDYYHSSSLNF